MEFLDLFLPINLSSASRAKVFLWLMFHYLQGPDKPNPFDDDYSRTNPPKVPRMYSLTREEQAQENVDPPDEIEWGKRMSTMRSKFLKELVDEMEMEKRRKKNPPPPPQTQPTASSYSRTSVPCVVEARIQGGVANSDAYIQFRKWRLSGRHGRRARGTSHLRPERAAAGPRTPMSRARTGRPRLPSCAASTAWKSSKVNSRAAVVAAAC